MVKLHIKRGDESQFLYETILPTLMSELMLQLVRLFNGRLKVDRLCQGRPHALIPIIYTYINDHPQILDWISYDVH